MKTKFTLALSIILFSGSLFGQTSGGPDTFGYTWKSDADPNGPTYSWKEIKNKGTQITGLGDDNQKGPFNINMNFRYYWTNYNKIWVGSNGWVAFQNIGNIAAPFPAIPAAGGPNNYLAPMACDLTFTQTNSSAVPGATAWYWTNNTDTTIIQYDSIPYWVSAGAGYSGRYTFQVILCGTDSSITYQYKVANAGTTAYDMSGERLTTGIENSTGQIGLQVLSNAFPTASSAVKFYYPNPVTYQVFDAAPAWNQNADNGGFFVTPDGNAKALKTNIFNAGNQPLSNISSMGEVLDVSSTQMWTDVFTVPSLAAGADVTMTYTLPYVPTSPGTFTFRSTTTTTGDINPANNVTDVELVVVDTTQTNIALSYVTSTAPSAANSWGGNGGQGIYVEPPFYPANITSLDFMVASSGTDGYHGVVILDDDGAGNSPGTVLYKDSVNASLAVAGSYNNVPLTTPLVITSGGFYVGWLENGDDSSAIGTETSIPLSNRNYEIIGGNWASFRNNSAEDLMIQVNIEQSLAVNNLTNTSFALGQNFPNPANGLTNIDYSLTKNGDVRFEVSNMLGEQIDALYIGSQNAGTYTLRVNTAKFNSGIYFYSLYVDGVGATKKMIVVK